MSRRHEQGLLRVVIGDNACVHVNRGDGWPESKGRVARRVHGLRKRIAFPQAVVQIDWTRLEMAKERADDDPA